MGARVVVNYRSDATAAEETAHEIGGEAVRCDVSDGPAVQAMVREIGQVDLLVNNAGAVRDKPAAPHEAGGLGPHHPDRT